MWSISNKLSLSLTSQQENQCLRFLWTWTEKVSLVSPWIGTTKKGMFEISVDMDGKRFIGLTLDWDYNKGNVMHPCHTMSKKHANDLNITDHRNPKTNLIHIFPQSMEPCYNMRSQKALPHLWKKLARNSAKRWLELFCTTQELSTDNLFALSSLAAEQTNPTKHTMQNTSNFLTMLQHKRMQL